jgi:hypothetical protein
MLHDVWAETLKDKSDLLEDVMSFRDDNSWKFFDLKEEGWEDEG